MHTGKVHALKARNDAAIIDIRDFPDPRYVERSPQFMEKLDFATRGQGRLWDPPGNRCGLSPKLGGHAEVCRTAGAFYYMLFSFPVVEGSVP